MRKFHTRLALGALGLILLLVTANGCGGSALVSAKGRLTYKGQPVRSTTVIFHPQEAGKRASHGITDDDGNFTLTNSMEDRGVFPGTHKVTLKYHLSAEEEMHKIEPKASKELREIIARFGDLKTTTLQYEIKSGGQFIEIKLDEGPLPPEGDSGPKTSPKRGD
jgi:hypothetical protein